MKARKEQLAREALGGQRFKYTAELSQEADGSFELVLAAAGVQGQHRMPDPAPERRPFVAGDLDTLGSDLQVFLTEWKRSQPESKNQVLCCTKAVENAIARARKKLADPGRRR